MARYSVDSERSMAVPEQREDIQESEPKAAAKRLTGTGLSPIVEKMFGALVDGQDAAGTEATSGSEARRASRPGAG